MTAIPIHLSLSTCPCTLCHHLSSVLTLLGDGDLDRSSLPCPRDGLLLCPPLRSWSWGVRGGERLRERLRPLRQAPTSQNNIGKSTQDAIAGPQQAQERPVVKNRMIYSMGTRQSQLAAEVLQSASHLQPSGSAAVKTAVLAQHMCGDTLPCNWNGTALTYNMKNSAAEVDECTKCLPYRLGATWALEAVDFIRNSDLYHMTLNNDEHLEQQCQTLRA